MGKEVRSREVDAAADVKKSIWRRPLPSSRRRRRRRRRMGPRSHVLFRSFLTQSCLTTFACKEFYSGNNGS